MSKTATLVDIPVVTATEAGQSKASVYWALVKPRPVSMVLLSTLTGAFLGATAQTTALQYFWVFICTALVGGGAMALNQVFEADADAQMLRTKTRPVPSGSISMSHAAAYGALLSCAGIALFLIAVNVTSALLALATLFSYLFLYTPLKRITSIATLIGAVPGALPPLIGWAGVGAPLGLRGLTIFLVVFFWQLPHFLAIAWMYRADYKRAGFAVLSVIDEKGSMVTRQMILYMCALMPVSLLPTVFGITGGSYFIAAFLAGVGFAGTIIYAASDLNARARYVLRASVIYLAVLFIMMMIDKV